MSPTKELLSAFVDGELDPRETSRIAALIEHDPELKNFVDDQEHLRNQLRAAFAGVMDAPVPERLLAAVATAPVSFRVRMREWLGASAGGARGTALRFAVPATAMALGVLIGIGFEQSPSPADLGVSPGGQIVARADLATALEHRLASDTGSARIGVTFLDKAGDACRSFQTAANAGLACRHDGEWQVGTLVSTPKSAATGGYTLAGSEMPDAIRDAISERMAGEPFDAAAERKARDSGWK